VRLKVVCIRVTGSSKSRKLGLVIYRASKKSMLSLRSIAGADTR